MLMEQNVNNDVILKSAYIRVSFHFFVSRRNFSRLRRISPRCDGKVEKTCIVRAYLNDPCSPVLSIFQDIIDRNQSWSFTAASVLPFFSTFPLHWGETRRNRLKFLRGTKIRILKTLGQFMSICFSFFSQHLYS